MIAFLIIFIAVVGAQNQVPPGLRNPPFVVVPPENERLAGSASERVDVFANQHSVVPQNNAPQSVPVIQGHPNNFPQSVPVPQGSHKQPSAVFPPQGNLPFQTLPPPEEEPALSPETIKLVQQTLDRTCLNCLCQASTNCEKTECILTGPEQYYCGPYQISFAYWADSGKPGDVPGDPHAFEKCLKNTACAERAILGYMSKYARDCNNDGQFDCQDVALIHKGGPHNCNGQWIINTEYWRRFGSCWGGTGTVDLRSSIFGRK